MLVDVVDDLVRDVVTNALPALAEQADLGRRDIVLNELRNHTNVVLPFLQTDERIIWMELVSLSMNRAHVVHTNVGTATLKDESAVNA